MTPEKLTQATAEAWRQLSGIYPGLIFNLQFDHEDAAGLVQVWPGWCTSYKAPEESREALNAAIKEMREEVKHIPTWKQYERGA